ncbi:MAG: efflux RND transporter permease subunit [Candidatus Eisenbacteria bacterium]
MNRAIEWFARHPVAANLLVITIIGSGLLTMTRIKQETFPEFSLDIVTISVVYRGAAPSEVEEGVCVRIEEQLQGLDGIERLTSVAAEGLGAVTVELASGADPSRLYNDIKTRVDAIDTFPVETEKPIVQEVVRRREVLSVALSGETDEAVLKELGERIRDEILGIEGITLVDLYAVRPYEISVEVSEEALRRYGITFDDVARAMRRSSLDMPGGSVKAEGGEILLRTKGQAYRGAEFEDLVVMTRPDGTRLLVGDVATVVDGFEDTDQTSLFDGKPAVLLQVFRVGDQSVLDISRKVNEYVKRSGDNLPEGISVTVWQNNSIVLRDRLSLLLRNGRNGFLLVFAALALFLRFRLAFWVSLGIPISFLGAFMLLPAMDVSINLISLFAFIIVLGIVVDDAIVVGENIFSHQEREDDPMKAAVSGAQEVATPVIFAVLTTVAAFAPLLAVGGSIGKVMGVIPLIVVPVLLISLVESLFILPRHLSHKKRRAAVPAGMSGGWRRAQKGFAELLQRFIEKAYRPSLDFGLRWRYFTVAWGLMTLIVTVGLVAGGHIHFVFFPRVDADYVAAQITMPQGTPVAVTGAAVEEIEGAVRRLGARIEEENGEDRAILHILSSTGDQPFKTRQQGSGPGGRQTSNVGAHLGEVVVELPRSEERSFSSADFARRWREETGPIPDALELAYTSSIFSPGADIEVQLTGLDMDVLRGAAVELKARLAEYPGVTDISDSFRPGKREMKLRIRPAAEPLGLTLADLAGQVRSGFYGAEAQRIQRGRDDVRVMVRYPREERRSVADVENMRIRTPAGGEVPFLEVADVEEGRGYASIRRVDRRRTVTVTAEVDPARGNAGEILADLQSGVLPGILADHDGVSYSFEGAQREQRKSMAGLGRGFLVALLVIYGLMAIPFRSYWQPALVMAAIPFGVVGAIWGHLLMGKDLTILSMFGMVALTGVVVNDSLVLVDKVNRLRLEGRPVGEAIRLAGELRFRPIILTSITTFAGLSPLIIERSVQAQFLIPMAISLAFGVVFSTFVTLVLIPTGYQIMEDVRRGAARLLGRHGGGEAEAEGQFSA